MKYMKVHWQHELPEEPILLLSEIDDARWEHRKIYIFRDGAPGIASDAESTRDVFLSTTPLPSLSEIAADPQFRPEEISKEEFEAAWNEARRKNGRD
ncbi:MAG: hypothetical protein EPO67_13170 [Reyranella sp.]|nr:MAG: hypothetical protein EPO67_13170 [Reyranella sp.]